MYSPPTPILLMAQELAQGGSERQLTEIVNALDRGLFSPHVAVLRPGGFRIDELKAAGVPTVCIPLRSFTSPGVLRASLQLNRYLRRNRIRLAHSFDVPANMFMAPVARFTGVPAVLSSQRAFRSLTPRRHRPLVRLADRLVDGIVVNCRALERHLIQDEGVKPSMIRLCYNGTNTEVFHRRNVNLPPELQGASLIVGVACALRPEKGLSTLVRAFAIAHGRHAGMKLVIVGSGAMRNPLEQLSCELGVRESCLFVPSTADVSRWLSSMDVFVLPSLSEALSNSLMEAMACGCAPIASDVGGNPELVAHGKRGLLFPADNPDELARHLVTFAEDEEFRRRCGEDSRDFVVRNFSLRASVQRMTQIYSEMLARKSRCGCDVS